MAGPPANLTSGYNFFTAAAKTCASECRTVSIGYDIINASTCILNYEFLLIITLNAQMRK